MRETINNMDFLASWVHGRRSRMAEGARLEALCRLPTITELWREVLGSPENDSRVAFQRRLLRDLAREVAGMARQLARAHADLLDWQLVRFRVEDLKLILRTLAAGRPAQSARPHLVSIDAASIPDFDSLGLAEAVEILLPMVPPGPLRRSLAGAPGLAELAGSAFRLEAELDRAYLGELLLRTDSLSGEERELVRPLVLQEIDAFHLLLVVRGRHLRGFPAEELAGLRVRGPAVSADRWAAMLAAPSLRVAARLALGRAVDDLPSESEGAGEGEVECAILESLIANRRIRLVRRVFHRSPMGFAMVVAYIELRRIELANLVTISEAIHIKLAEGDLNRRLLPRQHRESRHV